MVDGQSYRIRRFENDRRDSQLPIVGYFKTTLLAEWFFYGRDMIRNIE